MRADDVADLSREQWEHLIEQYIFNEQHRRIFKRRWLDGVCFEPLAEEFDISVRHAQNIVYKCEKKILRHIWKPAVDKTAAIGYNDIVGRAATRSAVFLPS